MTNATITLRIEGMTCLECAKTLERALATVPGVRNVEVSYGARQARVASGDANTEQLLSKLERVVEEHGYRASAASGRSDAAMPSQSRMRSPAHNTTEASTARTSTPTRSQVDLVVIGTGAAGMAAAIRASELGATVAIVEGGEHVGGTCVNTGCIPSKSLVEAAHHYHAARTGFPGISACDPAVAWAEVLRQKQEVVSTLRQERYVDVLNAYPGITLHRGRAALLADGGVRLVERVLRAPRVIIATGARPAVPAIPGLDEARALDSTSVMELERLPASLIVLGGGAIGLELGQALRRFGVRTVVVESADRILPNESPEISDALTESLRAEGLEIHTSTRVTSVERTGAGVQVRIERGRLKGVMVADELLVAVGRRPNTEALGLDVAGVKTDARGAIEVDEYMRTSRPDVYAAGDVTGGPGYVYVAALQGGIAAQTALADRAPEGAIAIDLGTIPRVTFTDPQVAAVGLSEAEARASGLNARVTTLPVRHLPRAMVSHRTSGQITLVAEEGTDRLLGAHVLAPNAGDVIGEAVLAVRFGLTTRDLVSTLHPYLTWGEGVKLTAQTFTKDVAKLSCCA